MEEGTEDNNHVDSVGRVLAVSRMACVASAAAQDQQELLEQWEQREGEAEQVSESLGLLDPL